MRSVLLTMLTLCASVPILAGCGDGGENGDTTAPSATTEASAQTLPADVYNALAAQRAGLGGETAPCSGDNFLVAGRCVAAQFVPLLRVVNAYTRDLRAARATVGGACGAALDGSIAFQAGQAARMRAIIAQGRKATTEAAFNRLNVLLTANGNAARVNDAARQRDPQIDWAVACKPAG